MTDIFNRLFRKILYIQTNSYFAQTNHIFHTKEIDKTNTNIRRRFDCETKMTDYTFTSYKLNNSQINHIDIITILHIMIKFTVWSAIQFKRNTTTKHLFAEFQYNINYGLYGITPPDIAPLLKGTLLHPIHILTNYWWSKAPLYQLKNSSKFHGWKPRAMAGGWATVLH